MSNHWEVHVIEFARSKDQPLIDLVNGAPPSKVLDLPFGFVLARNGERNVLIDTGFLNEGSGADFSKKFGIPEWISRQTALTLLHDAQQSIAARLA